MDVDSNLKNSWEDAIDRSAIIIKDIDAISVSVKTVHAPEDSRVNLVF